MTDYIDAQVVIDINDAESGQGLRDPNGLEGSVGRPWATFQGAELFSSPEAKAGALFHALTSTQPFVDGNKRTAWLASQYLLESLGQQLRPMPVSAQVVLGLTTATVRDWTAAKTATWFREHLMKDSDKLEYGFFAVEISQDDPAPGVWSGSGIGIAGLSVLPEQLPMTLSLDLVFRMLWTELDVGRKPRFDVIASHDRDGDHPSATMSIHSRLGVPRSELSIAWTGHSHHRDGVMPVVQAGFVEIEVVGPGSNWLVVTCDDEVLFSRPFPVEEHSGVPDGLPPSFT